MCNFINSLFRRRKPTWVVTYRRESLDKKREAITTYTNETSAIFLMHNLAKRNNLTKIEGETNTYGKPANGSSPQETVTIKKHRRRII